MSMSVHNNHARSTRIAASTEFVKSIKSGTSHSDERRLDNDPGRDLPRELSERIALLRINGEPRSELPVKISRHRIANIPFVKKNILRVWNYFSRPSRRQAQLTADCLEVIFEELRKNARNERP